MQHILPFCSLFCLMACASGGSSDGAVERTTVRDISDAPRLGGEELTTGRAGLVVDDRSYQSSGTFSGDKEMIFDVASSGNSLDHYLIVDGEFVRFVLLDHFEEVEAVGGFQAYGFEGERVYALSSGVFNYEGVYQIVSASNPRISGTSDDVIFEVDFDTGLISGGSVEGEQTRLSGLIGDQDIELMIHDQNGFHDAQGYFFGQDAQEFVGAYFESEQSGVIYTTQQ